MSTINYSVIFEISVTCLNAAEAIFYL